MQDKINPYVPAILNFVLLGAGYIYNRRRTSFGLALTIVALFATFVEITIWQNARDIFYYAFIEFFLLGSIFAVDGYYEARKLNNQLKPPPQN